MRSGARAAAAAVATFGAAWAAGCGVLYRRAFSPVRWGAEADRGWTPTDLGVPHEELAVTTADGVPLLAWYLPGTRSAGVVVSGGHRGRAGDVLGISAALWREGFHVVAYGWRGTPGSGPGAHTLGVLERHDLAAAVTAMRRRAGGVAVGLLGFSLGGAVSIVAAAADPRIAAVCADSAFADPAGVLGDGVQRVLRVPGAVLTAPAGALLALRTGARLRDFRPVDAVAGVSPRPLLLIHGTLDRAVPVSHARRIFEAAAEPKDLWLVEGVGHVGAYFADRTEYVRRVTGFFSEAMGAASEEATGT